ncbi:MAG: SHOCT domain-containing protein [Candidatus Bathyarchaeota archaeon]|nr:SHOCT domain-containing protein [Candidatus Bathyarchaeota archaeon]
MGVFNKLKSKTENTVKKGVDVGKKAGEKTLEIGKDVGEKGIEVGKQGVKKVRAAVKDDDPHKILKIRLAKGEITKEEYAEMKALLD